MKIKYFSQLWEMDTKGNEHIIGTNQIALWNDESYGCNPVKLQHRVLATPVDDNDPMACIVTDGTSVAIPTIHEMSDPARAALFCHEADKKLSPAFGWFFQGLHCTNLWAPSEQLVSDKYTGFREGGRLCIRDVTRTFQLSGKTFTNVDEFLPHIFVEPMDPADAGTVMYDIVTKTEVKVVDTYLPSTFRMRTALGGNDGEYVASTLLRHMIAKMWEVTSHAQKNYEYCFAAAKHAKFYIGYQYDPVQATDTAPIKAEDSARKIPKRIFLADIDTNDTALRPLYEEQRSMLAQTYHDVRYGASSVKTY